MIKIIYFMIFATKTQKKALSKIQMKDKAKK